MELCTIGYIVIIFLLFHLIRALMRTMKLKNLDEKPVLITGCDRGLGYDLAVSLCKLGVPVFATCLTENGTEKLRSETETLKGKNRFWAVLMDVNNAESCEKAGESVKEILGEKGLWGLVCNAGILGCPVPDDWQTPEKYNEVLSVNLIGTIRTVQLFRPLIMKSRGRIVFISSMLGKFGAPSCGPYCVSKFGMEGYAGVIRHEYRMLGVTMHILAPGFFTTHLSSNRHFLDQTEKAWRETTDYSRDIYGEKYKERLKATMVESLTRTSANGTSHVVDACVHALTAKYPKDRYTLGYDGHFFTFLAYFPFKIQDFCIDIWYGLSGAPIPRYVLEDMPEFTKLSFMEKRRLNKQEETYAKLHHL